MHACGDSIWPEEYSDNYQDNKCHINNLCGPPGKAYYEKNTAITRNNGKNNEYPGLIFRLFAK